MDVSSSKRKTIAGGVIFVSTNKILACGIPVVATSVGGIPEQVQDDITGFLTPPGDAEAMAAWIVQMLEDDELRLRMGMQAAEDAKQRFDVEGTAEEYLSWYGEILNRISL